MSIDGAGTLHPLLHDAADRTPDASIVRARLARLEEAGAPLDEPTLAATLIPVLANSTFLTRFLVRHPQWVTLLADREALRAPLSEETLHRWYRTPVDVAAGLRHLKHLAFLWITARDVAEGAPVATVCRELSLLADFAIGVAVAEARREVAARLGPAEGRRFVVMGMGKLGGRELNYSSDVDLVFFYDHDGALAGSSTAHEHFTRVAERVTRLLGEVTADGFVFRVDLRLRPEGPSGPLCNSVGAAERFYEAWGRDRERLAWLRARPVAGDLDLGHEVLARLDAWIHPRTADPRIFEGIAALKSQILEKRRAEQALGRAAGLDLKLDPGGIRAVEFFANALQLLYGGRQPALRDPSTLGALDRLYAAGLISARDHDRLATAYLLYRRVENRLQMEDERQTHRLPAGEARDALARRLGFTGGPHLLETLETHRAEVGRMFDDLLASGGEDEVAPEARLLLEASGAERVELLRAVGLLDPAQAAHLLEIAGRRPWSPLSPQGDTALGLRLLTEVLRSADPERALTHLTAFLARPAPLGTLRERPAIARLLVSLFAESDFLSDALLRHPDLVDHLYRRHPTPPPRRPDAERWAEAFGDWQRRETMRVGLSDLAGELDMAGVEAALTRLAETTLRAAVDEAERRLAARAPRPDGRFCVVAMGKLGGGELSYGSDLDLVFLFDGAAGAEWFTRLAQRTISLLSIGGLQRVDARLRPGGNQGTLVSRVASFVAWHTTRAGPWERLALVRARPVAGDPSLGDEVAAALERLTYDRPYPVGATAELRRLRRRIEAEVAREGPGRYNPKAGRGGLIDIELIVQSLQVRHGGERPTLRTPNTVLALRALRDEDLLHGADVLLEAHRFLRRLDHRLRIVRGQPVAELRSDRPGLDRLARRLGYRHSPIGPDGGAPGEQLLADYGRVTVRVRQAFERCFPESGGDDGQHQC